MAQEIELRIQTQNDKKLLNWLASFAQLKGTLVQDDYYLDNTNASYFYLDEKGNLQSDYWLRVRVNEAQNCNLCLKKVHRDKQKKYLYSDEYETNVTDYEKTLAIFEKIGFTQKIAVKKQRTEWIYQDFIIAHDRIENLGSFFEFELLPNQCSYDENIQKIKAFISSILDKDFILSQGGYPTLLYKKLQG